MPKQKEALTTNPFNAVNRGVYIADNLDFLRSINTASVDLVNIDPPFGKNDTFTADSLKPPLTTEEYDIEIALMKRWGISTATEADTAGIAWPDDDKAKGGYKDTWYWDKDIHQIWVDGIKASHPAVNMLIETSKQIHGDGIAAYLSFMAIRLFEIHRILKPTGSLFMHCDHSANGYLRQLLDAVFGKDNFRNEIAWCYTGPANAQRWFPRKHDTIFFYVKSSAAAFYKDAIRIPYKEDSFTMGSSKSLAKQGKGGDYKTGIEEQLAKGKVPEDWWKGIPSAGHIKSGELTGYPTQKPIALAERIVKAVTNPGDVVLDCFAGCAYTAIAAERLGRNWTACDINPRAWTVFKRQFNKPFLALLTCIEPTMGQQVLTGEEVTVHGYTELPVNTTGNAIQVKPLRTDNRNRQYKKESALLTRQEMLESLLSFSMGYAWCCGQVYRHKDGSLDYREYELDHIIPKSHGGDDDIDNRAPLCGPCNRIKSNRDIDLNQLRLEVAEDGLLKVRSKDLVNLNLARIYAVEKHKEAYQRKTGVVV